MKTVTISTFQNAYNYGAILQCMGLQNFLLKNKYNVNVLNYDNLNISNDYRVFKKVRGNHPILRFIKYFTRGIMNYKNLVLRKETFEKYIGKKLHLTKLMSLDEIFQEKFKNDVFITGSDQVWNTKITHGVDPIYTLSFSDDIKKLSYAASIGRNILPKTELQELSSKLQKFDHISVREETAKKILSSNLDKNIEVVLDPSFLLSKDEWWETVDRKERLITEPYIFVYMSFGECNKIVKHLQKLTGYKIVYIDEKNIFKKNAQNVSWANPDDFINLIKYSEYVVTTSFHATVFSIIFRKKFWVILPELVGSRITDLLNKFELTDRIANSLDMFVGKKYDADINYDTAYKCIDDSIAASKKWLINAIEK